MSLYKFSPILSEEKFQAVLEYIASETSKLAKLLLKQELAIDTLTIFAHYENEQAFLEKDVRSQGPESKFTHGTTLYVESDLDIAGQHITILGVRRPDPYRMQVGYGDFPVNDLEAYPQNQFVRTVQSGTGLRMLELWHPDFDVLGYIVPKEDHQ